MNARNEVSPAGRLRRRLRHTAVAALIGGVFAGLAGPSLAQEPQVQPGHRGGHHHGGKQMDPAARADRMERMVKRMFSSVKASEEQQTRAGAIVRQALADLQPIQAQRREGRKAAIELLSRPALDRGAIEAQRVEQARLAEIASKRMTRAFTDLAEVLTPEQRVELAKRMERSRGHRGMS
jgi:Spy/CpxP family protein refolding chaperone